MNGEIVPKENQEKLLPRFIHKRRVFQNKKIADKQCSKERMKNGLPYF
jgi:hypothetical protein